jgi:glycosyltransferase involved in cell wall biosynthesis
MLSVPSIVSARGNDLDRTVLAPSKAAHTLHALQHADAVTANSQDLARKARSLGGGRVVRVIPNGVDAELFCPGPTDMALRASLGIPEGPVIGFVGEARAKKGLAHLLVAFESLSARTPATLLFIGGVRKDDRPTLDVFRARHPDLPVIVVEDMPPAELPPYYRAIDVVVMPSLRDGLPNALLEAMACGRPVVATNAGGMPDVIENGENGTMVEVGDVDGLAAGIEALLADAGLSARYSEAARRTVVERFTPGREVDLTMALYHELAASRRDP